MSSIANNLLGIFGMGTPTPERRSFPASKRRASSELHRQDKQSRSSADDYQTPPYGGGDDYDKDDIDVGDPNAIDESPRPRLTPSSSRRKLQGKGQKPTRDATKRLTKRPDWASFSRLPPTEALANVKSMLANGEISKGMAEIVTMGIEAKSMRTGKSKNKDKGIVGGLPKVTAYGLQSDDEDSHVSDLPPNERVVIGMPPPMVETIIPRPMTRKSDPRNDPKLTSKPISKPVLKPTTSPPPTQLKDTILPNWDAMTTKEKWSSNPNRYARDCLDREAKSTARSTLQARAGEPQYVLRDAEIRDSLWHTMDLLERFATHFFDFEYAPAGGVVSPKMYAAMTPQTARIIACVASGGPGGEQGWHDLFVERAKRRALVCAVVANVLVEQVFRHIFFGGEAEDVRAVSGLQQTYKDGDGFDRNKYYAKLIDGKLVPNGTRYNLPTNFGNHVNNTIGAIWTHLKPIYAMGYRNTSHSPIPDSIFTSLHKIVTHAGLLSLNMRLDLHTVYQFAPVFKEDNFTDKAMECFNTTEMQQGNPRTALANLSPAEQDRRRGLDDAETRRSRGDEALTQITIMDGVSAYRLGGWETKTSTCTAPVYEKPAYRTQGVRARILTHAWVYCRWGRARGFANGKPRDGDAKTHGGAWKGGFVEFDHVPGVPQWLALERAARKAKTAVTGGEDGLTTGTPAGVRTQDKGKGKVVAQDAVGTTQPADTYATRAKAREQIARDSAKKIAPQTPRTTGPSASAKKAEEAARKASKIPIDLASQQEREREDWALFQQVQAETRGGSHAVGLDRDEEDVESADVDRYTLSEDSVGHDDGDDMEEIC